MQHKRKIFFVIIASLVFIFLTYPACAFRFNIDSPKIELELKPGEKYVGYITVDNYGFNVDLDVKVYMLDIMYLPDGTNDFVEFGSTAWSLADWIHVEPRSFILHGNSSKTIRYRIKAPLGATGGRYCVIFFDTMLPSVMPSLRSGATGGLRIGSVVAITARGTAEYRAELMGLRTEWLDEGSLVAWCILRNSGNILIKPIGEFVVMDREGREVARKDLNPRTTGIMPQTGGTLATELKADEIEWKEGENYILQVTIDYGGDNLLGGQTYFTSQIVNNE